MNILLDVRHAINQLHKFFERKPDSFLCRLSWSLVREIHILTKVNVQFALKGIYLYDCWSPSRFEKVADFVDLTLLVCKNASVLKWGKSVPSYIFLLWGTLGKSWETAIKIWVFLASRFIIGKHRGFFYLEGLCCYVLDFTMSFLLFIFVFRSSNHHLNLIEDVISIYVA